MSTHEAPIAQPGGVIPEQWTYVGPGWREWAFSFAVTALTAQSLMASANMSELLSAERFYSKVAGVSAFHTAAYIVNFGIIALVALWVFLSRRQVSFAWVIAALCVVGAGLCWGEIGLALRTQPNPVFVLRDLPYQPINNNGLAGAQVFLTYLIFKIPEGAMRTWPAIIIKTALAICLWLLQLAVWETVVRKIS